MAATKGFIVSTVRSIANKKNSVFFISPCTSNYTEVAAFDWCPCRPAANFLIKKCHRGANNFVLNCIMYVSLTRMILLVRRGSWHLLILEMISFTKTLSVGIK